MYIDESYARLRGRLYERILLKDSYRENGKVKKGRSEIFRIVQSKKLQRLNLA